MAEDSSNNNNNSSSQQQFKREPAVRIFAQELASVELTAGKEETQKAGKSGKRRISRRYAWAGATASTTQLQTS